MCVYIYVHPIYIYRCMCPRNNSIYIYIDTYICISMQQDGIWPCLRMGIFPAFGAAHDQSPWTSWEPHGNQPITNGPLPQPTSVSKAISESWGVELSS